MSYRRFLVGCLASALIFGAAIAAFNWVVDPAGVFGNSPGGIYIFNERPYKMVQVRAYPHQVLLVGSSKPAAFDPATLKDQRVYNASFAAAMPEEMLAFLGKRGGQEETVLIGLDFRMFLGEPGPLKEKITLGADGAAAKMRYLFSLPMFLDAVSHLYLSAIGRPYLITANGHWNFWTREELERVPWDLSGRRQTVLKVARSELAGSGFAKARLGVLHHMRALMDERNQAYRVFIDPIEVCILELIAASPARALFARFRNEVRAVFPDVLDYSVSTYSASKNFYRFDPYHYKTRVATSLIKDVLQGRQPEPVTGETMKCSN